ncbi:hypothetical protein ACVXHA_29255 [Escherichia coli]
MLPGLAAGKPTAAGEPWLALGCLVAAILGLPGLGGAPLTTCVTVLFRRVDYPGKPVAPRLAGSVENRRDICRNLDAPALDELQR